MGKRIKLGASIRGLQPQLFHAWDIADEVFSKQGVHAILTSGVDGKHGHGSFHYIGLAIDQRIRHLHSSENLANTTLRIKAKSVANEIRKILGPEYDVVLESTHIHIEFQPKVQVK